MTLAVHVSYCCLTTEPMSAVSMTLAVHVRPADLFLGIADRRSIKVREVADLTPEAGVVGLHGAQGRGQGSQSLLQACTKQQPPPNKPM